MLLCLDTIWQLLQDDQCFFQSISKRYPKRIRNGRSHTCLAYSIAVALPIPELAPVMRILLGIGTFLQLNQSYIYPMQPTTHQIGIRIQFKQTSNNRRRGFIGEKMTDTFAVIILCAYNISIPIITTSLINPSCFLNSSWIDCGKITETLLSS